MTQNYDTTCGCLCVALLAGVYVMVVVVAVAVAIHEKIMSSSMSVVRICETQKWTHAMRKCFRKICTAKRAFIVYTRAQ